MSRLCRDLNADTPRQGEAHLETPNAASKRGKSRCRLDLRQTQHDHKNADRNE